MDQVVLSGSMKAAFLRCPRYYKHAHVDKRQPRDRDGAMSFGTVWHESRAARWKGEAYTFKVDPKNKIGQHEVELLHAFDKAYYDLYGPARAKPLLVEERKIIGSMSVKFDALVKDSHGRTYVVEVKTTSSDISEGSSYWEKLTLDSQVSDYWLAAEALGYKLDGVLYDVIRKPLLRQGRSETREDFTERCVAAIVGDTDKHFARQIIKRLPATLAAAKQDHLEVTELIQLGKFPKNPRACFDWSRCCPYHDVCNGVASIDDDGLFEPSDYE